MPEARTWKNFAEVVGDCSFAKHLSNDHLDDHRKASERTDPVTVVVAHTTGATWASRQLKKKPDATNQDLLEWILDYYWRKGGTPRTSSSSHYFIWWDGRIFQLSDDHLRVGHVGVSSAERASYLGGGWKTGEKIGGQSISLRAVNEWRKAWPGYKSPQHLFPTKFVNDCSVGVEMAPCVIDGVARAEPIGKGYRHTLAQHQAYCALVMDVAKRWGWEGDWLTDPRGGPWSPRVAGHSDFDLFGRSTSKAGMWDPGGRRSPPWWDWTYVYRNLQTLKLFVDNGVVDVGWVLLSALSKIPVIGDIDLAEVNILKAA